MRVNNLRVIDFLGLRSIDAELKNGLHLFLGANGQGKSSIRDALSWGLVGVVRGLKRQKDYADIVRRGVKRAEVNFDIEHAGKKFDVQKKRTKTVAGGTDPAAVGAFLGVNLGVISACLDSWAFPSMGKDEKEEIIKAVFGSGIDLKSVEKALEKESLDKKYSAWIIDNLKKTPDFSKVHELAVAERLGAKRALNEVEVVELPETVEISGQVQKLDSLVAMNDEKSFEIRIQENTKKRDLLIEAIGRLKADDGADSKRSELVERMNSLRASAYTEEREKRLKKLVETVEERGKKIPELKSMIEGLEKEIEKLQREGEQVECPVPKFSGVPFCPACSGDELSGKTEELGELKKKLSGLQDEVEEEISLSRHKVDYDLIVNQLEALNASEEKSEKVDVTEEINGLENQASELQVRIDNSREAKKAIVDLFTKMSLADEADEKMKKISSEIEAWNVVVKLLDIDGIRKDINSDGMSALNSRLNRSIGMVGFKFRIDADFEIVLEDDRPFVLLSRSEKWRVGAAIAEAIAFHSGLGFFCLDECDVLVQVDQENFNGWAIGLIADYEQVFLFASSKDEPKAVAFEGLHIWKVENGVVDLLELKAAA